MLRVTDDTKAAYKADKAHKQLVIRIPEANITLTNEDIIEESMVLKESIESGDNFSFVGCISSCLSFECFDFFTDVKGMRIEADIVADNTEVIPLFKGYIDDVTNLTHEDYTRQITAYDVLYRINNAEVTSWYNSLPFPITIANMRNSFFAYMGVNQVPTYLVNDNMTVNKSIDDEHISGETIIKSICQINGVYGQIDRYGNFIYRTLTVGTQALYPREDLFPDEDLYPSAENALDNISKAHYKSVKYEDYEVAPITKVQLISREDQIIATAGKGSNAFTVSGNALIYDKSAAELQSVAQNLLNNVQYLWYVPTTVESVGLPYVECGDFVMCSTRRNIVRAYVLTRTLKGVQFLEDTFEAEGDEFQPVYVSNFKATTTASESNLSSAISTESSRAQTAESNMTKSFNSKIEDTANGLSSQIKQTASEIRLEVKDTKSGLESSITQTASSIRSEVKDTANGLSSRIEQTANQITIQANRINLLGDVVAQKATISQLNSLSAKIDSVASNRTFSGTIYTNGISIGGTTFNKAREINLFNSAGKYIGQATVLSS